LDWGRVFNRCAFDIAVMGEVNTWFDLQQIFLAPQGPLSPTHDVKTTRDASDINLYGLTIRANVDF
jgi:hypothetical protein